MKITQLRNATILIDFGRYRILVDPMLAAKDQLPPLRLLDGERRRNPLVDLPPAAGDALASSTHCLITHCQKGHFDHLDRAGKRWLRERGLPVICSPRDAAHLAARGLNVQPLRDTADEAQPFLDGTVRMIRCTHGRGLVGAMMEHGVGYLIEMPGEPSLYLVGDSVLSREVRACVVRHQPQVIVAPAGGARFDVGGDIIMDDSQVLELAGLADGIVVANHLEALSHCPVTRDALAQAARKAGIGLRIPRDGETLEFTASAAPSRATPGPRTPQYSLQP